MFVVVLRKSEISCCNSNAEFKIFPGDKTSDLRFLEEESSFSFSKNVLKLSYSNAEFKTFPGDSTPFQGKESQARSQGGALGGRAPPPAEGGVPPPPAEHGKKEKEKGEKRETKEKREKKRNNCYKLKWIFCCQFKLKII